MSNLCQIRRERKGGKTRVRAPGPHSPSQVRWNGDRTAPHSSYQIQEGSTPENHVEMMRNFSRFEIKLGQVLEYSLSQTAVSPLIRVILYDSKIYGLRLVLQCL